MITRVGPAIAPIAKEVIKKTPPAIGRSMAPVAGAVAKQSPKIAVGAAIYDAYKTAKENFSLPDYLSNKVIKNSEELLDILNEYAGPLVSSAGNAVNVLIQFAIKNSLPLGIVLAILAGGKIIWDIVKSSPSFKKSAM